MNLAAELQRKINNKTKPLGSLGQLEELALQIGSVQNTLTPELRKPKLFVFAADHGLAREGVSPYPQEVTFQMVMNFLNGGAAINVFSRINGIDLTIVDAGVNYDFKGIPYLVNKKVAMGTQSSLTGDAMTAVQLDQSLQSGADLVSEAAEDGCNIIGFGEMGIGNTSSASLLMSRFLNIPVEQCVGRGTGWNDEGLARKTEILKAVLKRHPESDDPRKILASLGGFEIAMMTGAMLKAADLGMLILVDGFISTAANIAAIRISRQVRDHSIYCHASGEAGHRKMLESLDAKPVLQLGMRLGEGTGSALAYPVIQGAVAFLNDMASFESAGVAEAEEVTEG